MAIVLRRLLAPLAVSVLLASGCGGGGKGPDSGTDGAAGREGMAGGAGFGGATGNGAAAGAGATGRAGTGGTSGGGGAGAGGGAGTAGAGNVADAGTPDGDAGDARDAAADAGMADDSRDADVDQPTTQPDAASGDAAGAGGMAGSGAGGMAGSGAGVPAACMLVGGAGGAGAAGRTGGAGAGPPACPGAAGDFDGDGIVDCAQLVPPTAGFLQSVVFYKGLPTNAYATTGVTTPNVVPVEQRILSTFDLDHDGRVDVLTASRSLDSMVWLLRGEVGGTFSPAVSYAPGVFWNGAGHPADYDGDGRVDLLLTSYSQLASPYDPRWIVLKSSAAGTFTAVASDPILPPLRAYIDEPVYVGDVTMDGYADVIMVVHPTPLAAFYLAVSVNNGDATFTTAAIPNSGFGSTFAVRDINGDNKLDLAVTFPGATVPFYGDGAGHFTPPPPVNATTVCGFEDFRTAPRGDFDGDGLLDCAYFQNGQSASLTDVVFRQGVGGGRYRVETVITTGIPVGALVTPYRAVDLTDDGRDDLLVQYQDQATQRYVTILLRGNADGTFAPPSNPPPAITTSFMPVGGGVGDFNGDGRKDVFMAAKQETGSAAGPLCLVTMSVVASSADPSVAEGCTSAIVNLGFAYVAAVADVNNDGKLDGVLVVGTASPTFEYRLAVALGDGTGRFTFAPSVGPYGIAGTEGVKAVTPVDCNGDGKIDLAVAFFDPGFNPKPTAILYGDGTGAFAR